ncbi:MAG: hypothetical protein J6Z11_08280, partial [Candidatus Riflebacteria bacterium]|nr:hypothetical protein [Candidatus Riflebacteria bacterium]
MSDKKKKLLVTIDSSMTDKWRNNQGNMSSVQIDNSMLEKWQQEKTRLEQEQNKKQETQNTTQKTKQKEANEFESLNNSNIPTPEDLKNQNTSSNLKATSPVERLQNKTQAVIRSEEEMNEAKEKLLNTKKSDYVADWAKFRDEYTKAGGEIPEWVNKLLDKAIPIQATGKTYVNHVETALTEAGRGIAKDEDYIANIDLKEHPVKKLLLSSTGSTIATAKPEWVENLIDSADSFYQKKEKENERLSTLANSDQSPLGQSIGYINDNIAPTIGEMTPAIVTNAVTGGSSAIPSAITQFFVSNGSYYRDAEQRGMNEDEAFLYSKIMAGVEAGTEYITASNVNKTGKLFKNITNGDFSKSVKELGFKQALAKLGEDTVEKGFFKSLATDMLENAFQEAITEPINELVAGGVADKADWSNIGNRMLQSAINGGIVAGIMGGASVGIPSAQSVTNKMETNIQNGKEVTSGITSQEIQKAYN